MDYVKCSWYLRMYVRAFSSTHKEFAFVEFQDTDHVTDALYYNIYLWS